MWLGGGKSCVDLWYTKSRGLLTGVISLLARSAWAWANRSLAGVDSAANVFLHGYNFLPKSLSTAGSLLNKNCFMQFWYNYLCKIQWLIESKEKVLISNWYLPMIHSFIKLVFNHALKFLFHGAKISTVVHTITFMSYRPAVILKKCESNINSQFIWALIHLFF